MFFEKTVNRLFIYYMYATNLKMSGMGTKRIYIDAKQMEKIEMMQ